jgi:hypothetical protein
VWDVSKVYFDGPRPWVAPSFRQVVMRWMAEGMPVEEVAVRYSVMKCSRPGSWGFEIGRD